MKTFDCFTFFNELDLLEFRLRFMDPYVDHFVIAESNLTFNGKPKPYYFEEVKDRFKPWMHKIIHIPVIQNAEGLSFENDERYNPASSAWKLENEQRNALLGAGNQMADDDLVIMSDLDEIPDPRILLKINKANLPMAFSLLFHYYYLNCQNIGESRWWKGCIASTGRQFKEITPQGLRDKRDVYPSFAKGGWHFSFLGGAEKISYKIRSFAHTEYNNIEFYNEQHILESISKGEDVLKRKGVKFKFFPFSYYPEKLQKLMRDYPGFIQKVNENVAVKLYYTIRRLLKGSY